MRINKYLAKCGLASRRKVEEFIVNGDVKVNGIVVTDLSLQIDSEEDIVEYKNKRVGITEGNVYIMLNKPPGYVVTKSDEFERKTVYDLLPEFAKNLNPIGRLDMDSEGLILLTNDGDFANKIIHPRYKLPKTYRVEAKGNISDDELKLLREGIVIEGKVTLPAKVYIQDQSNDEVHLKMIIYEGRKRQIRLMLDAIDCRVFNLKRTQIGEVSMAKLPHGMWRQLMPKEVLSLLEMVNNRRN